MNGIGAKKKRRPAWTELWRKVEEEGRCRVCGSPGPLDPAHTIRRSQGGEIRPEAVIPLCRDCHNTEADIDLIPYLTREEELEAVRVVGLSRAYRILGRVA